MIPDIESIVRQLLDGTMDSDTAIAYLNHHIKLSEEVALSTVTEAEYEESCQHEKESRRREAFEKCYLKILGNPHLTKEYYDCGLDNASVEREAEYSAKNMLAAADEFAREKE